MTKGLFAQLTKHEICKVKKLGFNSIFTSHKNVNSELINGLSDLGFEINIEITLFSGKDWWERYPNSIPIDRQGQPLDPINWYHGVCPNHPQVRQELLEEIKNLVKNYSFDGLYLDFIRYPCHWEIVRGDSITEYCFCSNCLKKYRQQMGGDPEGDNWYQWKCQQITDFVKQVYQIIEGSNKNIKLGLFAVPWRDQDYNNAITEIIGQDFGQLSQYVDVFSPMTYHLLTGNKPSWINEIVVYFAQQTDKPVLPLVQTMDEPKRLTNKSFRRSIEYAQKSPSKGVIIFHWQDLVKKDDKLEIVEEFLK